MEAIESYFRAEKNESIIFVAVGILMIIFSVYIFAVHKSNFTTGLIFPLTIIALLQISVGSTIYLRSPKDNNRVQHFISNDIQKIKTSELPRMEIVAKNFVIYRNVEILLILGGMFCMYYFKNNSLLKGIGVGLFAQSSFTLLLDFFAEKRAHEYLEILKVIVEKN